MQRLIGAATHEDRPWQHAISGIAGRKRIENSSKNLGVDGAQISESVPVFGLYAATSRALKDAVHAVLLPRRPRRKIAGLLRRASGMIRVCSVDTRAVASHG